MLGFPLRRPVFLLFVWDGDEDGAADVVMVVVTVNVVVEAALAAGLCLFFARVRAGAAGRDCCAGGADGAGGGVGDGSDERGGLVCAGRERREGRAAFCLTGVRLAVCKIGAKTRGRGGVGGRGRNMGGWCG